MTTKDTTHEDLRDFVDTAAIGLHWVAADGTILWANPADHEPLGYAAAEYVGHNIAEFHADGPVIEDILRRLKAGERLHDYAARLRCKDGTSRSVRITSSVKFDEAGNFLHTRCFTVPTSFRTQDGADARFEMLHREIERLTVIASRERGLVESILQVSPHGILVADAHGKLTLQNRAAERIWAGSATAEDIEGWGQYRGFHADGRPYAPDDWAMARSLRDGETVHPHETYIQRFDGTRGTVLGSSAPIFNADGEITGAVSVFADISQLKEKEAELRLSAQQYFTTLRSIGDAVIATDAEGHVTFMNNVAERLTGWTSDDARTKPLAQVFAIVNEQTRLEVESPVSKVLREGRIVGMANHTILVSRDGSEIPIDDSGAPIFDDEGALAGVVLVFRDVTEQRREEARRQFVNQASTLLASSLDYAPTLKTVAQLAVPTLADWCGVDLVEHGKVVRVAVAHVDPAKVRWAAEITERYPPDPSSRHGAHEVIRTGKSLLMAEIPEALLTAAAVDEEHLRLIRELGLRSVMIVPLRAHGKTLGAISFVATDPKRIFGPNDLAFAEEVSNIAALAVNNARLYSEAQLANHAKDEFLATVSHELRTPLNAMLGWAKLLRKPGMPEAKREHGLETIERNAKAQAQLIEDLLDVSRIISGKLTLESRPVDLVSVIEAAADSVRLAAEGKRVALELRLEANPPVEGDGGRLQQVVWNLLSNAVKFTDPGGTVTVRLQREPAGAELTVSDTGIGIDAEFLPHVFERFRQADSRTTRIHGGLGIGLAIVRHLVELHGGAVEAASPGPKRGATFTVRLPVAAFRGLQASPGATPGSTIDAPTLVGLRVLVVDDEADTRALLVEILEGHGAVVRAVSSAAEAVDALADSVPDVLVSDIGLPGEDGYSLIRRIRVLTKDHPKPLRTVALTAYARMEDRTRALMAGFHSHVAKPVEPAELVIVVATLAGRTG